MLKFISNKKVVRYLMLFVWHFKVISNKKVVRNLMLFVWHFKVIMKESSKN